MGEDSQSESGPFEGDAASVSSRLYAQWLEQCKKNAASLDELFGEDSPAEQARRQLVNAATRRADEYLRSPAFLRLMRQQVDALIEFRRRGGSSLPKAKFDQKPAVPDAGVEPSAPGATSPGGRRSKRSNRGVTPHAVVHRNGDLRLLHYRGRDRGFREPVLICYSLINRPYVLDLFPQRSVVRRLLESHLDVYLLDWGVPANADHAKSLADYICDDLHQTVELVRRRSGGRQISLLGYCMGGTMSAMYAALHPARVRNLILMATPIDFEDPQGLLRAWTNKEYFDVDSLVGAFGNCPGELLQFCFQMMRPIQNFHEKYVTLMRKRDDREFLVNFQAMERWTVDSVPVAGQAFRDLVTHCYQQNLLARGELALRSQRIALRDIDCPLLLLTADYDHLVPPQSSLALAELVASRDIGKLSIDAGHVGLAVSRKAHDQLWPAACSWIAEHSTRIP